MIWNLLAETCSLSNENQGIEPFVGAMHKRGRVLRNRTLLIEDLIIDLAVTGKDRNFVVDFEIAVEILILYMIVRYHSKNVSCH